MQPPSPEQMEFGLVLSSMMATAIGADAFRRGDRLLVVIFWAFWAFMAPCLTLPFYIHFRLTRTHSKPKPTTQCQYCGALIVGQPAYCPHCSRQLRGSDEIHRKSG